MFSCHFKVDFFVPNTSSSAPFDIGMVRFVFCQVTVSWINYDVHVIATSCWPCFGLCQVHLVLKLQCFALLHITSALVHLL